MLLSVVFALFAALLLVPQPLVAAVKEVELGEVEIVKFCLPLTVLLTPSEADAAKLTVEADEDVENALISTEDGGELALGLGAAFKTEKAIKVTISIPATRLNRVVNFGSGTTVLGPGFSSKTLTFVNTGPGTIIARGLDIENAIVQQTGAGGLGVFLEGKIDELKAEMSGIGDMYVVGVESLADITISGIGNAFISGSDDMRVTGMTNGFTSEISIDNGDCELRSRFTAFRTPRCGSFDKDDIPVVKTRWVCGLEIEGQTDCLKAGSGATAQAGTSDGSAFAAATATASSSSSASSAAASSGDDGLDASSGGLAFKFLECDEDDGALEVLQGEKDDEGVDD